MSKSGSKVEAQDVSAAAPTAPTGRARRARLLLNQVLALEVGKHRHGVPHPPGERVRLETPAGYHIDLRAKLDTPDWDLPADVADVMWIDDVTQPGLAMFEHYVWTGDAAWLDGARVLADYLAETQRQDEPFVGAWTFGRPMPHTFDVRPPWVSAMAQGQAASLLTRIAIETERDDLAAAASAAFDPFTREIGTPGGCRGAFPDGSVVFEEYPTVPGSHVLNGFIYALYGLFDVWKGLGDERAEQLFREGAESLCRNLQRWDTGYWSRYDLYPYRVPNVASPFYHRLHIDQLRSFERLWSDPRIPFMRERFLRYAGRHENRARAISAKVRFRFHVPRWNPIARVRGLMPLRDRGGSTAG